MVEKWEFIGKFQKFVVFFRRGCFRSESRDFNCDFLDIKSFDHQKRRSLVIIFLIFVIKYRFSIIKKEWIGRHFGWILRYSDHSKQKQSIFLLKFVFYYKIVKIFSLELIKSRFCLFASYYIFELFKKNHKHRYLILFQFIFDSLNEPMENRAIVLQAIETLNYIVIDNTDYERMKLIINNLMNSVKNSGTIEKIQEFPFFEFLSNAIK